MKVKIQRILIVTIMILIIATGCVVQYTNSPHDKQVEKVEPLNITTTPKNTLGTITIYDEHGSVYYQYIGEIDVRSSGWGGDEVEIVVNLSSTGCSCFDEAGNLIQEGKTDE